MGFDRGHRPPGIHARADDPRRGHPHPRPRRPSAREAFIASGYDITGELSSGGFSAQEPDAMPVEVVARRDAWLENTLADLRRDPAGHPVLARPYLTLLKLQAGRTQDLADIQRLLATTPATERASTRDLVERHAPELVEDYDSLITLSDLEFSDG